MISKSIYVHILMCRFTDVITSGPCHPAHSVPQCPMGADGHWSAGLPEISDYRAACAVSVLITRAC